MPISRCGRPSLAWEGRGAGLNVAADNFPLHQITKDYSAVIPLALFDADASKVSPSTDAIGAVYRGRLINVFYRLAHRPTSSCSEELRLAIEIQASKICPGDADGIPASIGFPVSDGCSVSIGFPVSEGCSVSDGCPGDADGGDRLADDDSSSNHPKHKNRDFAAKCKLALCPSGAENSEVVIAELFRQAHRLNLSSNPPRNLRRN